MKREIIFFCHGNGIFQSSVDSPNRRRKKDLDPNLWFSINYFAAALCMQHARVQQPFLKTEGPHHEWLKFVLLTFWWPNKNVEF